MPAPVTPDELHVRLAARIREIARAKGLSLEAVADAAGVRYGHFWGVLGGRYSPKLATIAKIAAGLGVDPHELFRPHRR